MGRLGALLLAAPLLSSVAEASYAIPAHAQAVPTCRGVPATIVGTPGHDDIVGTDGDDVIVGGRGADHIRGLGGDDLICGGPTHERAGGESITQALYGGLGNDTLIGGSGIDDMFSGPGSDLLIGLQGNDYMDGAAGTDTLRGGPGSDGMLGQEGDDQLVGGRGPDFMSDAEGNNSLGGGRGDDMAESGPGNETIRGGRGRDTVSYLVVITLAADGGGHCNDITVDLAAGTASGDGFGTDTLDGIESVWTAGGHDVLIGDEGPNEFYTGFPCPDDPAPTESVTGNGGFDRITFDIEALDYSFAPGPVEVDLQANTARWGDEGSANRVLITLSSIENAAGTEYSDVILGDDGPNVLVGRSSGDLINGRGGDDLLFGNRYNDSLDGGPGANTNDGGPDTDTCLNPSQGALAVNCEG